MQIFLINLDSKTETLIYQASGEALTDVDSLAVSPNGEMIVWAEHFNDYEILVYCAQFDGRRIVGAPKPIWNGVTSGKNTACNPNFISNEQFVFFLKQLNDSAVYNDAVLLADTVTGSAYKAYSYGSIKNPAVSNSGDYIAYWWVSSVFLLNTKTWEAFALDNFENSGSSLYSDHLAWSPDDAYLVLNYDTKILLYDLSDLSSKWMLTRMENEISKMQWR